MLVFFVLDRSHASVLIAWICFSSPYQSCSPGCGAPRPFLFGLKPSTGLVGSIPAGAARWLRVLFFLLLSSYPRVRSAVSVHFFSQFVSACGLSICVQSSLDSFLLHGPRAKSDFLASASVLRGDLCSWFHSSSCVKLSPSTGLGSEFHQPLQKI
jgi:hypothetical protein